ncbi:hypothetical protein KDX31_07025 [Amphritea atlantica]|uniref:Uncharacterized protein n=1 Tax=Amphritea atlantica TaxID=355243 RepID=A0ABY5GZA4_9GAMM|nr:hypothetical protein KDX31_07025 [Amphritea atlantica]
MAGFSSGLSIWLMQATNAGFRIVQITKKRTNSVPIMVVGIKKVRKFAGDLRGKR